MAVAGKGGKVYTFGLGADGQLGVGTVSVCPNPVPVLALTQPANAVFAGDDFSFVIVNVLIFIFYFYIL